MYQRGSRRLSLFENRGDAFFYLSLFFKLAEERDVEILAFCLMKNHVHHLLRFLREGSFSSFFKSLNHAYSQRMNPRFEITGHLFAGRPQTKEVEEESLDVVRNYIERNPVAARIVERKEDYLWSSAHPRWKKYLIKG